jgi:hypothetical protein
MTGCEHDGVNYRFSLARNRWLVGAIEAELGRPPNWRDGPPNRRATVNDLM